MSLSAAMRHPKLFGPNFKGETWAAWRTVAKILDDVELTDAEREWYEQYTGRAYIAGAASSIREVWFIKGRRLGFSRFASFVACHRSACVDYSEQLAAGEVGTFALIASDKKQARTMRRYVDGFIDGISHLRALVAKRTSEAVEFTNNTCIEIHTCSFRSTRGYTLIGAACDELAFWNVDGYCPDTAVLDALRPGMSTIPSAILLCGSSPYARRGALWQAYTDHYGKPGDVLVFVTPTRSMNPTVPQSVIDKAMAADELAASSEYYAQFRRDVAGYLSIDQLEPIILHGITSLAPVKDRTYIGHLDAASGSGSDSLTAAVAYVDTEIDAAVLAATLEIKPPFSPTTACETVGRFLKEYRVTMVQADRWGGEFVAEQLARNGIRVEPCPDDRSTLYAKLLPLVTSQRVRLLDDRKRLIAQCLTLERKTGRLRDIIDHIPGGHDDVINSAAGALVRAHGTQVVACPPVSITKVNEFHDYASDPWPASRW